MKKYIIIVAVFFMSYFAGHAFGAEFYEVRNQGDYMRAQTLIEAKVGISGLMSLVLSSERYYLSSGEFPKDFLKLDTALEGGIKEADGSVTWEGFHFRFGTEKGKNFIFAKRETKESGELYTLYYEFKEQIEDVYTPRTFLCREPGDYSNFCWLIANDNQGNPKVIDTMPAFPRNTYVPAPRDTTSECGKEHDEMEKTFSPLYKAVRKADLEAVKKLVNKNIVNRTLTVPVGERKIEGSKTATCEVMGQGTLLHLAVFYLTRGPMGEVIKYLLETGANPDAKNERGETALQTLVRKTFYSAGAQQILIEGGASVNFNVDGGTPLLIYYINNWDYSDLAVPAINHGADLSGTKGSAALLAAIDNGRTEIIKALLDKGVNPDVSYNSRFPFYEAVNAKSNALGIAKILLENEKHKADVNLSGMPNPLLAALNNKNSNVVKLLVDNGADVGRDCALELAVRLDRLSDLRYMVEKGKGADINSADCPPLLKSAQSPSMSSYLKSKGASDGSPQPKPVYQKGLER